MGCVCSAGNRRAIVFYFFLSLFCSCPLFLFLVAASLARDITHLAVVMGWPRPPLGDTRSHPPPVATPAPRFLRPPSSARRRAGPLAALGTPAPVTRTTHVSPVSKHGDWSCTAPRRPGLLPGPWGVVWGGGEPRLGAAGRCTRGGGGGGRRPPGGRGGGGGGGGGRRGARFFFFRRRGADGLKMVRRR